MNTDYHFLEDNIFGIYGPNLFRHRNNFAKT